ncbi:peptidoglycan-recognition protein 2-like [Macrosteles quadrilineatus]|uniref:peptidoglycan-recognition protein 2-like n=1 Tax=Macrosteles quadrilineatus TaxID=74068 RepID=UPI0023E2388F|nr:peptidoglycan-recognition protein 2-like [Macrosteles quadrilineatus]
MPFKIEPREMWMAKEPKKQMIPDIVKPAIYVFFSYVLKDYDKRINIHPGPRPDFLATCRELLYIQRGDMRKLPDIRFNFAIGPDGSVYTGRGWDKRPTLPRAFSHFCWNSLYISFIGDFRTEDPSDEAFHSKEEFLRLGVREKHINPRFVEFFLGYRPNALDPK